MQEPRVLEKCWGVLLAHHPERWELQGGPRRKRDKKVLGDGQTVATRPEERTVRRTNLIDQASDKLDPAYSATIHQTNKRAKGQSDRKLHNELLQLESANGCILTHHLLRQRYH